MLVPRLNLLLLKGGEIRAATKFIIPNIIKLQIFPLLLLLRRGDLSRKHFIIIQLHSQAGVVEIQKTTSFTLICIYLHEGEIRAFN
jgi:hypothetical protein